MTDPFKNEDSLAFCYYQALENYSPFDKVGLAYLAAGNRERILAQCRCLSDKQDKNDCTQSLRRVKLL